MGEKEMLGCVLVGPKKVEIKQVPDVKAEAGEVVVRIHAAALNRRDYWITQGLYPAIQWPSVLGGDAAGIVEELGGGVEQDYRGKEVVINPGVGWPENERGPDGPYLMLGMDPLPGTLTERIKVPKEQVFPKPPHLSMIEAAALPLAGATAWRATFTKGQVRPGQKVLIPGIGGGVAVFCLKFAVAAGCKVWVTSSSPEKIQKAKEMGAEGGVLYTDPKWVNNLKKVAGPIDCVLDGAGGSNLPNYVKASNIGGKIVMYGSTDLTQPKLSLAPIFLKQIEILGTTMCSAAEFHDMLNFVSKHKIRPAIDRVFPLKDAVQGIQMMEKSSQFGKIAISVLPERVSKL